MKNKKWENCGLKEAGELLGLKRNIKRDLLAD
jgi:hypothetical protein